ncbi:MAG: heavy metal-binding domain-containing protein [Bdellovibrionales bacterium]|nr:heavy metal-binding domain-containing protein [Bdellovibrionales bacterium]
MGQLLGVIILATLGYITGRHFEKKHFRSLAHRENQLNHIPVVTAEWKNHIEDQDEGFAVSAGIVVASDYFKTLVSQLKNLTGGRLTSYESLLDRGRREALLRIKEKASRLGAHTIVNVRIETSTVNSSSRNKGALPCVELFAYGTALRKKK